MCICVCICANNMQILGFGGVGGVRSGGGIPLGGEGGCGGPGTGLIYIHTYIHTCMVYLYITSQPAHTYMYICILYIHTCALHFQIE